jgi:hypothetical protein
VLTGTLEVAGYRVRVWEEASRADYPSQDAWLATERQGALRAATIDGSTPPADARGRVGLDAAAYAAQVTRAVLAGADLDVPAALAAANSHLHEPELRSQAQSMATVVCLELDATGAAQVTRGGNCELWVVRGGEAVSVFGDQFTQSATAEYRARLAAEPSASAFAVSALEEELFSDPANWVSVPVGRFPETYLERAELAPGWERLVLASDGARLDAERVLALEDWLFGLRTWEDEYRLAYAVEKRHDDVTVLEIT